MAWEVFTGQQTRAREWSPEEDRVVLALSGECSDAEMVDLLPRRTAKAIRIRRSRLRDGS